MKPVNGIGSAAFTSQWMQANGMQMAVGGMAAQSVQAQQMAALGLSGPLNMPGVFSGATFVPGHGQALSVMGRLAAPYSDLPLQNRRFSSGLTDFSYSTSYWASYAGMVMDQNAALRQQLSEAQSLLQRVLGAQFAQGSQVYSAEPAAEAPTTTQPVAQGAYTFTTPAVATSHLPVLQGVAQALPTTGIVPIMPTTRAVEANDPSAATQQPQASTRQDVVPIPQTVLPNSPAELDASVYTDPKVLGRALFAAYLQLSTDLQQSPVIEAAIAANGVVRPQIARVESALVRLSALLQKAPETLSANDVQVIAEEARPLGLTADIRALAHNTNSIAVEDVASLIATAVFENNAAERAIDAIIAGPLSGQKTGQSHILFTDPNDIVKRIVLGVDPKAAKLDPRDIDSSEDLDEALAQVSAAGSSQGLASGAHA